SRADGHQAVRRAATTLARAKSETTATSRDNGASMNSASEEARVAAQWWHGLQPYFSNGERNPNADRAALARLRRADLLAAMQDPVTFALFRALGRQRATELPQVALCAAVLAGVRDDRSGERPARTLGPPSIDALEHAAMKPLRFRRLIEAEAPE